MKHWKLWCTWLGIFFCLIVREMRLTPQFIANLVWLLILFFCCMFHAWCFNQVVEKQLGMIEETWWKKLMKFRLMKENEVACSCHRVMAGKYLLHECIDWAYEETYWIGPDTLDTFFITFFVVSIAFDNILLNFDKSPSIWLATFSYYLLLEVCDALFHIRFYLFSFFLHVSLVILCHTRLWILVDFPNSSFCCFKWL